jgi:RNA polymerase sigma-70 factor, ECF subfamily
MQQLKRINVHCQSLEERDRAGPRRDSEAFEMIYRGHREFVRRVCFRMLRDPAESEDASQDVFFHVFRKIHTFRGESAFSTWLYRLTINLVLMRLRKKRHDWPPLGSREDGDDASSEIRGLDSHALSGRIDLELAIGQLPDGYKMAFILHDVQGYDHREVSEILGSSVGNSKSQLFKARRRLRKLLGGMPKETAKEDLRSGVC